VYTAVILPPGGRPFEVTPILESMSWTTAAVGGFGSCSFAVPGDRRRRLTPLARVYVRYGTQSVWEGRIEDRSLTVSDGNLTTTVSCFGLQRLLSDVSVRRIWMKRDIAWVETQIGTGGALFNSQNLGGPPSNPGRAAAGSLPAAVGRFDDSDPTKNGVRFSGSGVAVGSNFGNQVQWPIPVGLSLIGVIADVAYTGTNFASLSKIGVLCDIDNYPSGVSAGPFSGVDGFVYFTHPLTGIFHFGVLNVSAGSLTPAVTEKAEITNIRLLGTNTTNTGSNTDMAAGFYGGAVLRDLIALVPGLTAGIIEDGSDFTIQAIERTVRDTALSVVDEVAGYYTRRWAVWEDGKFDWRTPNDDEAQYLISIGDCTNLELGDSIDALARTAYVLYTDAATGVEAEASATATSQRNPYAKTGDTKDLLTNVGFPMTSNTAAQLATQIAASRGAYPPVTGRIELRASAMVHNAVAGFSVPAALIRGGANIVIPELPRDETLSQGRDGQTLFHVVATDTDLATGTVTLELETQAREIDLITARLAAATRTLTG
jgi:hypothetical protein